MGLWGFVCVVSRARRHCCSRRGHSASLAAQQVRAAWENPALLPSQAGGLTEEGMRGCVLPHGVNVAGALLGRPVEVLDLVISVQVPWDNQILRSACFVPSSPAPSAISTAFSPQWSQ